MYSYDNNMIFHHIGFPHSEILGSTVGCHLPEAYRRLRRPSSAFCAKASTIRSLLDEKSLTLLFFEITWLTIDCLKCCYFTYWYELLKCGPRDTLFYRLRGFEKTIHDSINRNRPLKSPQCSTIY